jgi:RNA-directed DNA polymerase
MADDQARLYSLIVRSTPEQVLLERMRLHGFWPPDEGLPPEPADQAAERARIEAELATLQQQLDDPNYRQALEAERRRRWEESKARRAARKLQRQQQADACREADRQRRASSIVHAGVGVSAGLHQHSGDPAKLAELGLPLVQTPAELAAAMKLSLPKLRWLTFHRRGATLVHYHRYEISKKTGGVRCISAPKPALAAAQRWVLEEILAKLPVAAVAHGFVPGRSILSNAQAHLGRAVVLNLDLRDFFPSITWRRVKGIFRRRGYSESVAVLLALLCTEPPRLPTELDGKLYYVALSERILPQGACTSPAITNLLCRRLDARLAGLASRHGYTYTRYADDLTFSGDHTAAIGLLLRSVRSIVQAEGLTEHPRKTKIMRRSRRQEVTGVTVNVAPGLARRELRQLRAILHNAATKPGGLAAQNRQHHPNFAAHLRGRIAFLHMLSPKKAQPLRAALQAILQNESSH